MEKLNFINVSHVFVTKCEDNRGRMRARIDTSLHGLLVNDNQLKEIKEFTNIFIENSEVWDCQKKDGNIYEVFTITTKDDIKQMEDTVIKFKEIVIEDKEFLEIDKILSQNYIKGENDF